MGLDDATRIGNRRIALGARQEGASGFTLVELLVVVAIIGVLAGLLLPVLGGAKTRARNVQCLGNLRQLGILARLHAEDHRGRLPQLRGDFAVGHERASDLAGLNLQDPRVLVCPADRVGGLRPEEAVSYRWNETAGGQLLHGDRLAEAGDRGLAVGALFFDRESWHGHRNAVFADGRALILEEP